MLELMLFGGLARAQTPLPIVAGVWNISASVSPWTILSSIKVNPYKLDYSLLPDFTRVAHEVPDSSADWREYLVLYMVRRSFEIWRRLKYSDIMRSLALNKGVMHYRVSGQVSSLYKDNIQRDGDYWVLTNPDLGKYHKHLSPSGIEAARRRARQWKAEGRWEKTL